MNRRGRGKIARLPFALRDQVGQRIRDNIPYSAVAAWLAEQGHPGITEKNVENWAKPDPATARCGYADWLRDRERMDELAARREWCLAIARENAGSTIHEANLTLAASQLNEMLEDFDFSTLKTALQEKPELMLKLLDRVPALGRGGLDFAEYRDRAAEAKRKLESLTAEAKKAGGITAETLKQIEDAAALL